MTAMIMILSEGDLSNFCLEFVDSGQEGAVQEIVSGVHLESTKNCSVDLISHSERNTLVAFLESSFNLSSFFVAESLSRDDSNGLFLVQDSVVRNVLISDLWKGIESIVFNQGVDEIISGSSEVGSTKSTDDISLLSALERHIAQESSENFAFFI